MEVPKWMRGRPCPGVRLSSCPVPRFCYAIRHTCRPSRRKLEAVPATEIFQLQPCHSDLPLANNYLKYFKYLPLRGAFERRGDRLESSADGRNQTTERERDPTKMAPLLPYLYLFEIDDQPW